MLLSHSSSQNKSRSMMTVGEMLTRELSWIQALIDAQLWRRIQLRRRVGSVTVISDASWSQTEDGLISRLCHLVFTAEGPAFGLGLCTSRLICDSAEMIASILLPLLHPALFRGKAVTFFFDNVCALMALVKGGCAKRDLAKICANGQCSSRHIALVRIRSFSVKCQ